MANNNLVTPWSGSYYTNYNFTSLLLLLLALKCDDPPEPSKGAFISNGSVVTYFCEEGFALVGNRQRFCNLTSWQWNGSDPTCEGMSPW